MGAAPEIEACSCGGPRSHYRKAGSATALCGLTVEESSGQRYNGRTCVNCARRKKEIDAFSSPAPAQRYQLACTKNSDLVHLVRIKPASPQWTESRTVCDKSVDALISFDAVVSCKRCSSLVAASS